MSKDTANNIKVIQAVVVAIVLLKDKIKLVEMAFDLLMIPIKAVIQALKDLTDWIGLTSFAEEEGMDPKEIMNGFKGFISVIGQLSNSFVQMGIKLLANPLFLLVSVVAAVVVAIALFKAAILLFKLSTF